MLKAVEQGIHERFTLEEVIPLGVIEVGGNNGGVSSIAIVHEFEEGIDLFGLEGEVAELINDQDVVSAPSS